MSPTARFIKNSMPATPLLEKSDPAISSFIQDDTLGLDQTHTEVVRMARSLKNNGLVQSEMTWEGVYQKLYQKLGIGIWEDAGPYKTGFSAYDYAYQIPPDFLAGQTGTVMDNFINALYRTGRLPNISKLWLSAYLIHWRKVRWQSGAQWFLMHQLNGQPAVNNLAWQWVASTYSARPFIFNLADLEGHGVSLEGFNNSPFAGSIREVAGRLFPNLPRDQE